VTVVDLFSSLDYGPAPESAQPAIEWIDGHGAKFGNYINGQWADPVSGEYFETINPATTQPLALVAQSDLSDVEQAVTAARRAAPAWANLSGHERARFLYALARRVQRNSRLLSVLESLDNGKTIRETRDIDIPLVARHFYYHAGWAQLAQTELHDFKPLGVVGQIIPWNFPLLMLAWKIAPALAMGNTVVLKPAEFTPLTALAFAELVNEAGLPPGVVNIITGDGSTGELLVNSAVDKIAFTGSTEVGRAIRSATAGSGKRLSLELGGKSPFVVYEDADLDSAVEGLVDAIWFNQGQVCCAGSRLLVQESIANILLDKIRRRMETLRAGDPLDKAVDIGPLVAAEQLERVDRLVKQGLAEGADIWQPSWRCPTGGYFFPPTLLTNVAPASTVAQVEIFGPVLVSMSFRTPTEAVALANNTRYGLAASVWSENINLALDAARRIKAGSVWVNCTNMFDAASGFGGYRESGYGREGGREGLYEYLQVRKSEATLHSVSGCASKESRSPRAARGDSSIDRTPKLYIGGKQVRPDSGYSRPVHDSNGRVIGEIGDGNRKDIRNAVEAANAAEGWMWSTAHNRAQVLYYVAENLATRRLEFANRLDEHGGSLTGGADEVDATIERLFTFAAWTDKFDGEVHQTPFRNMTVALNEAVGVIGIVCPQAFPLLGFVTPVAAAIAMGNAVVAVPSEAQPLAATDLYQVLDTSDLPDGVVNIVTGASSALLPVLAGHDDVDALWCWSSHRDATAAERDSVGNMKRTWIEWQDVNWQSLSGEHIHEFLRQGTQVKNIWVPYGA
jgi:aldehyde dehydrogenase (NAD+)